MILRVRANTLLVLVGIAACSGKGGNNSGTSALPEGDPNGGFDSPGSGFDVPPPSTDAPGGQDTPPPDHDSTTGEDIGAACVRICSMVIAQCFDLVVDVNACLPACNDILDEHGPCAEAQASFFECQVRSPGFACELDDGLEDGDYGECNLHALLFQNCIRVHDPDPDGGGGTGGQGGGPQGGTAGDAPTGGTSTGGVGGNPTGGSSTGGLAGAGTGGMATGGASGAGGAGGVGGV